jgi:FAD:protein FMN transferase
MSSFKRMRPLLGTFVEIGYKEADKEKCDIDYKNAVAAAFDVVEKLHQLLSFHETTSDLTRLNQAKGKAVEAHPHTIRVIKLARGMTIASNGLFNCTLGGAMIQSKVLPDHDLLLGGGADILPSGVAADIQIIGKTIQLKKSIKITLDGIAKGYAVDCAIATMKRYGVKAGWVNAGGDLRVYGDLVLPIQRRNANGNYVALGGLQNAAIATSVVTVDVNETFPGKIMSDIVTPNIGAWSVMAHYAWRADALTKVAALAKDNQRNEVIKCLGGVMVYPK